MSRVPASPSRVPVTPPAGQVPRARSRTSRNVEVDTATEIKLNEPSAEIKALAKDAYVLNKQSNAAKGAYDKKRKALTGLLADLKDEKKPHEFQFKELIDGKSITLEVGLKEGSKTLIDLTKLKELVGEDTFMKIVSATKTAIETFAGTTVYDQCAKTTGNGEFTASIAAAK